MTKFINRKDEQSCVIWLVCVSFISIYRNKCKHVKNEGTKQIEGTYGT